MKTASIRIPSLALAFSLLGALALAHPVAAQHLPDPPIGTSASAPAIEPLPGVVTWTSPTPSQSGLGWFVHHPTAGLVWLILAPEGTALKPASAAPARRVDARLLKGRGFARVVR